MARQSLPSWAADYIGIPFVDFGRDRQGLDCWGLVRLVLLEVFKIETPSYAEEYQSALDRSSVGTHIDSVVADPEWLEIAVGHEEVGDVIVTRVHGLPCHVGIVIAHGFMLHVHPGINTAIEDYTRVKWRNSIRGFYRFKTF